MSNEIKYAPADDPNVQLIADTLVDALGLKVLPHVALVEIAQRVVAKMKIEAGEPEPFFVGNTYRTQDGQLVKFVGVANEGNSYETMVDENGHHRYTRRGADSGRLTGTNGEFGEGGNVRPLYARPPAYAIPPMTLMVPEGYKILKTTTFEERKWPGGDYYGKCCDCGREFMGPKRQHICNVCVNEVEAPLIPTAIHGLGNGAFKIGHFNVFTDVKNDPEYKGEAVVSYGERLVYKEPKAPEAMTNMELSGAIIKMQRLLEHRLAVINGEEKPDAAQDVGLKMWKAAGGHTDLSSAPLSESDGMPT